MKIMKRRKHKKVINHWQGFIHSSNKEARKTLKNIEIKSGSMFKKILNWFEYN